MLMDMYPAGGGEGEALKMEGDCDMGDVQVGLV